MTKTNVNKLYRRAVADHMRQWQKQNSVEKCSICDEPPCMIECDHTPTFASILDAFLIAKGYDPKLPGIFHSLRDHVDEFKAFYAERAGYRWLCYTCHKEVSRRKTPPYLKVYGWNMRDYLAWEAMKFTPYDNYPNARPCGCGPRDIAGQDCNHGVIQ